MPCERCGESLDRSIDAPHECAPDRLVEFEMFGLREEIAELDARYRSYLRTPHGRFECWLAARHVRRSR